MSDSNECAGRLSIGKLGRNLSAACRVGMIALALTLVAAIGLPPLPLVGHEFGAIPAFAKNDRSSERSQGNRGRGHDQRSERSARSDARDTGGGSRIWNRPRSRDHSDNGRHLGHHRSGSSAPEQRTAAAAPESPPLPPHRPDADESGFRNHGDRVSTFVAIAKSVGLNGGTGAMQANFGTPFENGLVATDEDSGEFLKDEDTGEYIIDATDEEIAEVKPGNGPRTDWEIDTSLDVNMDGIVDKDDLE